MITGKKAAAASVICTFMENMIPRYSTIRGNRFETPPAAACTQSYGSLPRQRGTSLNDLPGLVLYMPGKRQILGVVIQGVTDGFQEIL